MSYALAVAKTTDSYLENALNIGIVGCGYVADHYMETFHFHPQLKLIGITDKDPARAEVLAKHYKLRIFDSAEALIDDPQVQLVVNLTDPENHYLINKAALQAGKHVYSEKPLSTDIEQASELLQIAEEKGLILSSAPCSVLGEAAQTLWKAVDSGAIGQTKLVYAELDDNPIYLMQPEGWTNARGVPWPYLGEYEVGCTLEHAGYYLTWFAAMFGPAKSVTAFSSCLVPEKSDPPMETPDLSVACIHFENGVVARLTCSIIAPYDHRIQIVGDEGVLTCNECWHYGAPVYLERFSQISLNARKARTVRRSSLLRSIFGVGGRRQKFVSRPFSQTRTAWQELTSGKASWLRGIARMVSKRELVSMDFFRGVADMASAIESGDTCLLDAAFVLHVNELTLAIQNSGESGAAYQLTTTFEPRQATRAMDQCDHVYGKDRSGLLASLMNKIIGMLHKH